MDLFINRQNFDHLNSYFLRHYSLALLRDLIREPRNQNLKISAVHPTVNLRPDFNSDSFPSFHLLIAKFTDFIKFSNNLKHWGNIWFRVKLVDIPYCVFSPADALETEYLMENNESADKIKLSRCASCKYHNLCGGIHKKYLQKYYERNTSLPNAVKFFLYDLMAEDAFQSGDLETCQTAVAEASAYLPTAREDLTQCFRDYVPSIRLFERGVALALDEGELEQALALCNQAIALGLGKVYEAKRASIERMM